MKEDPRKPHPNSYTISPGTDKNFSVDSMSTVLLMDRTDKLVYQFTFDISKDGEISNRFVAAILKNDKERNVSMIWIRISLLLIAKFYSLYFPLNETNSFLWFFLSRQIIFQTESVIFSDGIAEHMKGYQPQVPTSGPAFG